MSAARLGGPALLLATAAGMLAFSWGAWPNVFVDFGRELYVPWRLAEGESLHADIAWFNGPLSVYAHAALFALFGPGLWLLVDANLAATAATAALLYAPVGDSRHKTASQR